MLGCSKGKIALTNGFLSGKHGADPKIGADEEFIPLLLDTLLMAESTRLPVAGSSGMPLSSPPPPQDTFGHASQGRLPHGMAVL
mmetsp:Transcript_117446/g.374272  ORF Transcript_117446/g.374272 Transcript_117446/m.374272 type:complete len:84 (-) Transcript_117446:1292-1543(-)